MSKRSSETEAERDSVTTEATLVSLAEQVAGFVAAGTLDSRFAAKLAKRLEKEFEVISDSKSGTASGRKSVKKALDALDAALRGHDAQLLVAANAALRASQAS